MTKVGVFCCTLGCLKMSGVLHESRTASHSGPRVLTVCHAVMRKQQIVCATCWCLWQEGVSNMCISDMGLGLCRIFRGILWCTTKESEQLQTARPLHLNCFPNAQ